MWSMSGWMQFETHMPGVVNSQVKPLCRSSGKLLSRISL
jgi:hypothetical protein